MASPARLKAGDKVAIIAPSRNLNIISNLNIQRAEDALRKLGLQVIYGGRINCENWQGSASIADRLHDLHAAFRDREIKAILTVIGGFNCNELLSGIDWQLIRENPKIVCGFSDITALTMAIYSQTGLITYSGPHFSTFALSDDVYVTDYFVKCLFDTHPFTVHPSKQWRCDEWYLHESPKWQTNEGPWHLHGDPNLEIKEGLVAIAGNLAVVSLLQGIFTFPQSHLPHILLLEWCAESQDGLNLAFFTQRLVSLLQCLSCPPALILMGRMEDASKIYQSDMERLCVHLSHLLGDCVVSANWDFGHTLPIFTIPVGGTASFQKGVLTFIKH